MHSMTTETNKTLDQDDLLPDEEESLDINDILRITSNREAKLQQELEQEKEERQRQHELQSSDGESEGPDFDRSGYGSDRDDDIVTFAGQATFSMHSRKAAKKARRPKFERSKDALVQIGSLTRAGDAAQAGLAGLAGLDGRDSSQTFARLGVSSILSGHLEKHGYKSPTPVQARSIPPLLGGRDVLVESATGSGKTLSYLVPIFDSLASKASTDKVSRGDGTLAMVLCPTRELCLQVLDIATIISRRFTWIVPGSIHGGENRAKEKARLRKGVNVLICTPGRLYDHLTKTAAFDVSRVEWIVLDEADRLLDMGFKKQISSILKVVQERKLKRGHTALQTALLSATLSGVRDLLAVVPMRDPVTVRGGDNTTGGNHGDTAAERRFYEDIPETLVQQYVVVPCKFRLIALMAAIKQHLRSGGDASLQSKKILVFLSNCDSVDFHQALLQTHWDTCGGRVHSQEEHGKGQETQPAIIKLHGNMTQIERTRSLLSFTRESRGILLATDVASRGLDFPEVSMIIQYDAPMGPEEYVHRVGRTARFGRHGSALLFVSPAECGFINYLHSQCGITALGKRDGAELLNDGYGVDKKAGKSLVLELHRGGNVASQAIKAALAKDAELTKLAEMAFTSSVRSYCTHSRELKEYFKVSQLHLGHYANSFGLKENPKAAGGKKHHRGKGNRDRQEKKSRLAFADGDDHFNAKGGKKPGPKRKKGNAMSGFYVSS